MDGPLLKNMNELNLQSRMSDDPEDYSYLNNMPLHSSRVWTKVRAYAIKRSHDESKENIDLNCRFCITNVPEIQEHLEICAGMEFGIWRLDLAESDGQLKFWRRVTVKLSNLAAATQPSRRGALNN